MHKRIVLFALVACIIAARSDDTCDLWCPPRQARSAFHCECTWIECPPGLQLRWGEQQLVCTPPVSKLPCVPPGTKVLMARDQFARCLLVNTTATWMATREGLVFFKV